MFAFVLGTVRGPPVAPSIGELPAVLIEAPIMLAASWWICARVMRRFGVGPTRWARLIVGALSLGLLMVFEFMGGCLILGRSGAQQLAAITTVAGLVGLTGRMLFATIPALQGLTSRIPVRV